MFEILKSINPVGFFIFSFLYYFLGRLSILIIARVKGIREFQVKRYPSRVILQKHFWVKAISNSTWFLLVLPFVFLLTPNAGIDFITYEEFVLIAVSLLIVSILVLLVNFKRSKIIIAEKDGKFFLNDREVSYADLKNLKVKPVWYFIGTIGYNVTIDYGSGSQLVLSAGRKADAESLVRKLSSLELRPDYAPAQNSSTSI